MLGSTLADAAGAPNDPVGRAHAATDALVGAFAVVMRSMHTPSNVRSTTAAPAVGVPVAVTGAAPVADGAAAGEPLSTSSSGGGSGTGGGGGIDNDDVWAWHAFLKHHLQALKTSFDELPGQHRTREQQLQRITELQQTLAGKQVALDSAVVDAKSQLEEHRVSGRRLLKIARRADDTAAGGGSGESEEDSE